MWTWDPRIRGNNRRKVKKPQWQSFLLKSLPQASLLLKIWLLVRPKVCTDTSAAFATAPFWCHTRISKSPSGPKLHLPSPSSPHLLLLFYSHLGEHSPHPLHPPASETSRWPLTSPLSSPLRQTRSCLLFWIFPPAPFPPICISISTVLNQIITTSCLQWNNSHPWVSLLPGHPTQHQRRLVC